MAESYIPEGTDIICTNMTGGVPMQIMQQRAEAYTVHDAKDKPLLNVDDRKLSGPFSCVVPGMFWGGLEALCLGIAIAALVVATVATGGLALVAVGVVLGACAVGIVAGVTALCKIPHACDATLSLPSEWISPHDNVIIEGAEALLNKSSLICSKGGVLNLIMNPVIAMDAAMMISDHNMNQFYIQMGSQFLMGIVGTVAAAGNPISLIGSSVISVGSYFVFEDSKDDDMEKNDILLDALEGTGENILVEAVGKTLPGLALEGAGATIYAVGSLSNSVDKMLMGGVLSAVGKHDIISNWSNAGLKGGLAGFLINLVIGVGSDAWEEYEENMAIAASANANEEDKNNALSVIAIDI